MSFDDLLRNIFAESLYVPVEQITPDITVHNTDQWDSMSSMVLSVTLEETFDIQFTDRELVELDSYVKIREALIAKGVA